MRNDIDLCVQGRFESFSKYYKTFPNNRIHVDIVGRVYRASLGFVGFGVLMNRLPPLSLLSGISSVTLTWIFGHMGLSEYDEVDRAVK